MEDFVLPEEWCLLIDNTNIEIVREWRKQKGYELTTSLIRYVHEDCLIVDHSYGRPIITTYQFIKYVLNQDIKVVNENNEYLINILNKYNIC